MAHRIAFIMPKGPDNLRESRDLFAFFVFVNAIGHRTREGQRGHRLRQQITVSESDTV